MPRPLPLVVSLAICVAAVAPLVADASAQASGAVPAQSLWGAKNGLGLQDYWLSGRPVWAGKPSGSGVRVAVVGTGMDPSHPDLQEKLACPACWRDMTSGQPAPYDDNGHGTFTAGIIAASGHLQINPFRYYWPGGARGIAPHAGLLVAKALDRDGATTDDRVAEAVRWSIDPNGDGDRSDGAHIIHLALSFSTTNGQDAPLTRKAVREAVALGVIVVAPAGDGGATQPRVPSVEPGVIVVGAATKDGLVLESSDRGPHVDLWAPASLVSTYPHALDEGDFARDGYSAFVSTSAAAALVAGAAALVLDAAPALLAPDAGPGRVAYVEALLKTTSTPLPSAPPDAGPGGMLDLEAALTAADRGTDTIYLPFFLALGAAGLLVALMLFKLGRRLRRPAEE